MSAEIFTSGATEKTLYALVYNQAAQVWNTSTLLFEVPLNTNWSHYVILLVEEDNSGVYTANFPTGIVTAGIFPIDIRNQAGGSPAVSDPIYATGAVNWSGFAQITSGAYLITLDQFKAFYGITTTANDTQYNAIIAAVAAQIDKYLTFHVMATDYTETRNGTGNNFLRLLNRPINSLTSVTLAVDTTAPVSMDISKISIWSAQGMLQFKPGAINFNFDSDNNGTSGIFVQGFQNISIGYNAGFNAGQVPADLQRAAAMMIYQTYVKTSPALLTDLQKWGGFEIKFGAAALNLTVVISDEAKTILDYYKPVKYIF